MSEELRIGDRVRRKKSQQDVYGIVSHLYDDGRTEVKWDRGRCSHTIVLAHRLRLIRRPDYPTAPPSRHRTPPPGTRGEPPVGEP